jgi:hypothetical protein
VKVLLLEERVEKDSEASPHLTTNGGRLRCVEVAIAHAVGVGISEARRRGGAVGIVRSHERRW